MDQDKNIDWVFQNIMVTDREKSGLSLENPLGRGVMEEVKATNIVDLNACLTIACAKVLNPSSPPIMNCYEVIQIKALTNKNKNLGIELFKL